MSIKPASCLPFVSRLVSGVTVCVGVGTTTEDRDAEYAVDREFPNSRSTRARVASHFPFTARRAPGPAHSIFSSGSHFYCHCYLFFLHRALFFISRRSFHSPLSYPFVFHCACSSGLSPSPRSFFPHRLLALSLSLSFFLAPQREPSSSLVFVFEAYNRVGAVFDLESTLVRGSCRFSFPFYLISSLCN